MTRRDALKIYMLVISLLFTSAVKAEIFNPKINLTPNQIHLLKIAKEEGEKVGYPRLIPAILWQESHAGAFKSTIPSNAYCPMQIKLSAARDVLKGYGMKDIPDKELKRKLLTNSRFCISIGARYFKMMAVQTHLNMAVLAYNQGLTGARLGRNPNDYVQKVKRARDIRLMEFYKVY